MSTSMVIFPPKVIDTMNQRKIKRTSQHHMLQTMSQHIEELNKYSQTYWGV